jgi:hypothetical protein
MDKQYSVKFCDLPHEEQERFWEFLKATARNRPVVEGEGDCAWRSDYDAFARVH